MAHLNNLLAVLEKKLIEKETVEFPVDILLDNECGFLDFKFGREYLQQFHIDSQLHYISMIC
jgi:hypothetical protein